jgi:hypothetical protein
MDRLTVRHWPRWFTRPRRPKGDPGWCTYLIVNGEIDRLFKHHMEKLGAA